MTLVTYVFGCGKVTTAKRLLSSQLEQRILILASSKQSTLIHLQLPSFDVTSQACCCHAGIWTVKNRVKRVGSDLLRGRLADNY